MDNAFRADIIAQCAGFEVRTMSRIALFYVAGFIVQVIHSLFGYSDPVPCNRHIRRSLLRGRVFIALTTERGIWPLYISSANSV